MLQNNNQPSSSSTTPAHDDGKSQQNFQVLNISNVNAQKEVVLNDEQLLGLIQMYPYLYNPMVKPYKDPDYDNYAWDQITKSFNRSYETLDRNPAVWYTTDELKERWNLLQPIVRSLSKISNIKSLPDSLRQTVIKMSVPMNDQPMSESSKKPLSAAQKTIRANIGMVKKLPLVHRRRLEAEIMELILNCELNSRATIKLGATEQNTVENECREFLKAAGLQEITASNQPAAETVATNIQQSQHQSQTHLHQELAKAHAQSQAQQQIISSDESIKFPMPFKIKVEDDIKMEIEEDLLKPLPSLKWVPLTNWQQYVRKCRVRIKRANLEDEIPLARIKRERLGV